MTAREDIWGFKMFWFCISHKQSDLEVLTLKNAKLFACKAFALPSHTESVWTIMFRNSNMVDNQMEEYRCNVKLLWSSDDLTLWKFLY